MPRAATNHFHLGRLVQRPTFSERFCAARCLATGVALAHRNAAPPRPLERDHRPLGRSHAGAVPAAKRSLASTPHFRWVTALGLCLVVLVLVPVAGVHAQQVACDEAVARAEADYFGGRFDEALEPLNRCLLEDAFSPAQQQEAYTLLGRIYFAKGLEVEAREALRKLLQMVPGYEPNPNLPPSFKALVLEIKQELAVRAGPSVASTGPDPGGMLPSTGASSRMVTLPAGTRVTVQLTQALTPVNGHDEGTPVHFVVAEDIVIDGHVIVPRGIPAYGVVTHVRRAKAVRRGSLRFHIVAAKSIDGQDILLHSKEFGVKAARGEEAFVRAGGLYEATVLHATPVAVP